MKFAYSDIARFVQSAYGVAMVKPRNVLVLCVSALICAACQTLPDLDRPQSDDILPEKIFKNVAEMGRSAVVDTGLATLAKKAAFDFSRPVAELSKSAKVVAAKNDMAFLDKDGDMRLTLSEYRNAMTPSGEYRLEAASHNLTVARFVRAEFYIADLNQDGFIDSPELIALRKRGRADKYAAILAYRPF